MHKKTLAKLAGFVIAAGTTATLIGFAANGTGAYFTDSKSGNFNVSTGSVEVHTPSGISNLDFTGLLPGVYKTVSFTFNTSGSGSEDIYLELPNDPALAAPAAPGPSPLGRYGHFAVSGPAGKFSSFNLAANPSPPVSGPDGQTCLTDSYGRSQDGIGQTSEATGLSDHSLQFCPAPKFILLAYGINAGGLDQSASITFGFTGLLSNTNTDAPTSSNPLIHYQSGPLSSMPFNVVAVQHGVSPIDQRNSPGSNF